MRDGRPKKLWRRQRLRTGGGKSRRTGPPKGKEVGQVVGGGGGEEDVSGVRRDPPKRAKGRGAVEREGERDGR